MTYFIETISGTIKKLRDTFSCKNRYLAFKEQLNTRTRPEDIISGVPDLTLSTQDSSTAATAVSTPLNPFKVTPEVTQEAISQKPEKESFTPPTTLKSCFPYPSPHSRNAITTRPEA